MTAVDATRPDPHFGGGRILRATVWLVIGTTFGKLLSVGTTLFLARELAVEDFGAFSLALGYGALFSRLASLGLDAITVRELAARPPEDDGAVIGSALAVRGAMVVVALAIAGAGLVLAEPGLALASYIAAASVVATLPTTVGLLLNARLRVSSVVSTQLAVGAASVVVTVLAARAGAGITALVAIQSASTVVGAIAVAAIAHRRVVSRYRVDRPIIGALTRGMAPLVLTSLAILIYHRSDIVLLGRYRSEVEVAGYSAASRVVEAFNLLPLALANVVLPSLSHFGSSGRADDRSQRMSEMSYRLLASIALPLAAVGTVAGPEVLGLLFGADYRFASTVLAILLWAHYFGHMGVLVHQVLIAEGLAARFARLTVPAALINLGLNLWAIPRYGAAGAAWTSMLAYGTPFVVGAFVPRIRDPIRACLRAGVRPLLASLMVLVVLWPVNAGTAVVLPLAAVTTVVALVLTRSTTVEELRYLASRLRDRSTPNPPASVPGPGEGTHG